MAKIGSKVINLSLSGKINNQKKKLDNVTNAQLPSIENLSETMKGAGIMGEVDMPSPASPGAMVFSYNGRVNSEDQFAMVAPKLQEFELRYAVDNYSTSDVAMKVGAHKAVIKGFPKKCDVGKVEPGGTQDVSNEYSVIYYKHTIDGKTVIEIDVFNYVYVVNGVDYAKDIRAAL